MGPRDYLLLTSYRKQPFSSKIWKNRVIFREFDYRKWIFMQNKCDIQNQHAKIRQTTLLFIVKFSHQNLSCRDYKLKSKGYRAQILTKNKVFLGVFFHIDSEYHAHFA